MSDKKNKKDKDIKDTKEKEVVVEEPKVAEELDPMEVLQAENEELKNDVLRKIAEFDNFKKRTAREKEDIFTFARANCVEGLLSVLDNFERALETECTDQEFKKGVDMIFAQFSEGLKKLGLEEIEAMNIEFNPEYHNAVNQIEDENFGQNTVCQVFQKGYKIGAKVIRHSMVVVANP